MGGLAVLARLLSPGPGLEALDAEAVAAVAPPSAEITATALDTVSNTEPARTEPVLEPPVSVQLTTPPVSAEALVAGLEMILPNLFAAELRDASEAWVPSRESLHYWTLELYLGQIDELAMRRVATLIGPDDPYAGFVAAQLDVGLTTALPFPSETDVDRLWSSPDTRSLYEEALRSKHYADIVDAASSRHADLLRSRCGGSDSEFVTMRDADALYAQLAQLRTDLEAAEAQWWELLWAADSTVYPHWSFLMRVARYHFN